MKERIHIDTEFGEVLLRRRPGSRYIRLRVTPQGGIVVTLPWLAELAAEHGFEYNKVFIKHNRSNWGSCSTRGK